MIVEIFTSLSPTLPPSLSLSLPLSLLLSLPHSLSLSPSPTHTSPPPLSMQGLGPVGGKLSGDKARPVMMASKLPMDALGKRWNFDRDGQLDSEEFAVVSSTLL